VVAARFIEAGDKMGAAGTSRAAADGEPAGELGLSGGGERRTFLVPNTDPFDVTAPNRIGDWIE
jgi:hypothetical protein